MDATASPTYPHGFEASLGGESTMRTVAGFGTSQGTPQRAAAVMRVSCKLPNTKRPFRGDPVRAWETARASTGARQ
jgi:hypothetical protein